MKPWERDWRAAGQPVAAPPAAAPKPWERDWRSTAEPAAAATAAVQPTAEADGGSIADLLGAAGARTYQTVGGAARDFAQNTRSEEHTSELQSLMRTSYAVFCVKKTKKPNSNH